MFKASKCKFHVQIYAVLWCAWHFVVVVSSMENKMLIHKFFCSTVFWQALQVGIDKIRKFGAGQFFLDFGHRSKIFLDDYDSKTKVVLWFFKLYIFHNSIFVLTFCFFFFTNFQNWTLIKTVFGSPNSDSWPWYSWQLTSRLSLYTCIFTLQKKYPHEQFSKSQGPELTEPIY